MPTRNIFIELIIFIMVTAQLVQCSALIDPSIITNIRHQIDNSHDGMLEPRTLTLDSNTDKQHNTKLIDLITKYGSSAPSIVSFLNIIDENQDQDKNQCGSPENLHTGQFSYYDYAIVGGMLMVSLGIGVFYGFFYSSGTTSGDFLLGSGMSLLPVTLSLTTNFITAIELLGNPAEMYYNGTQFSLIVIPIVLVIPVAIKIFYPIYFKLELTSCYEYLGIRFGKDIRIMGSILYIIQMCFYTAVAVLAPAIALSKATGLNTRIAVVLIYLVCIFYSSQGGMKAVVIADSFQAVVLAISLVLIVILGYFYTGDYQTIIETSAANDRLEFFNFDPNPTTRHTVFSIVIGGFFYWTSLFCTNQASVQKCMSLKSLKLAKIALGLSVTGLIIVFLINFYTGLTVYTHYSDCDPLSFGRIGAPDQLLPFYVMDTYGHIATITGIYVAGIFAASLGTVASALNSLSAVTIEDLLINGVNMKIQPDQGAKYAKWMSLGYGVFSFILVFIVEKLGGVLQATLTLNGLIGGVTLGLYVLGIAFKKANQKGAFYGGVLSLIIVIYIGVMAQITNVQPDFLPLSMEKCNCKMPNETVIILDVSTSTNAEELSLLGSNKTNQDIVETEEEYQGFSFSVVYQISYMWYSMFGTMLTIIFGLIISFISDAIQKHKVLKITTRTKHDSEDAIKDKFSQQKSSKWNDIKVGEQYICNSQKNGIDNFALKIDDEKF